MVGGVVLRWGRVKPLAVQNTLSHPPAQGFYRTEHLQYAGHKQSQFISPNVEGKGKGAMFRFECSSQLKSELEIHFDLNTLKWHALGGPPVVNTTGLSLLIAHLAHML